MPRRLTPFQIRLAHYLQAEAKRGRSHADVARVDLKISPAMLTDYRIGDSLPNRRDADRTDVLQKVLGLTATEWDVMIGESERIRAEDDRAREQELSQAVERFIGSPSSSQSRARKGLAFAGFPPGAEPLLRAGAS